MICCHCGSEVSTSTKAFCTACQTLRNDIDKAGKRYHIFEEEARRVKLQFEMAEAATQAARDRYHTLRAVFVSRKAKTVAHMLQTT